MGLARKSVRRERINIVLQPNEMPTQVKELEDVLEAKDTKIQALQQQASYSGLSGLCISGYRYTVSALAAELADSRMQKYLSHIAQAC